MLKEISECCGEMMPRFCLTSAVCLTSEVVTLYRADSAGFRLLDFHFFFFSFLALFYISVLGGNAQRQSGEVTVELSCTK